MIVFTDGWHPTINASSRMPIFYLRYNELFGDLPVNVLCETPRTNGGTTLRDVILNNGKIHVTELNKPIKYMAWGANSSSDTKIYDIFQKVSQSQNSSDIGYMYFLNRYKATQSNDLTIGEAVCKTNYNLMNEIFELPKVQLVTMIKSPVFKLFFEAMEEFCRLGIFRVLDKYLQIVGRKAIYSFAFLLDENEIYRIEYLGGSQLFLAHRNKAREILSIDRFTELYLRGFIFQSSLFTSFLEIIIANSGVELFHFGNVYGHLDIASKALKMKNSVQFLDDNEDSWNFAFLKDCQGNEYPLHLLDIYSHKDVLGKAVVNLINESFETRKPIMIEWLYGDWIDAVLNRGA